MKLITRALTFLVLMCCCPWLHAQTLSAANQGDRPLKQLSLEELSQVEVTTTSKEPVPVMRTAAATYVITSEDIRRSGVTTIADALRLAPGVEVGEIDSHTWAVGIRGLQSNFSKSVLVLIDGRSVYTPLFAGVYWDVQDLMLDDIDRIEVIRGPGATIWGPNAANGVINIVTKSSAETQGVEVQASAGTLDRTVDAVRYGGRIGQHFTYRIYGKGRARGSEYHFAGAEYDNWHQGRGGFRADWSKDGNHVLVEGDGYGGNSPHLLGAATVSDDSISGGDALVRWRHNFDNGSDLYVQSYFDRTIRIGPEFGETRNTIDIDMLHHFRIDRHEISWGGGLRWSPDLVKAPSPGLKVNPAQLNEHNHSLFGQDEIHFLDDRLSVIVGLKLQHNNFTGFDAQPTVRLLYAPTERTSYWTAVTRAVTTPSRIEEGFLLQGALPGVVVQVTGNPDFKSESTIGYEAGFRHLFTKKFFVDVAAFHNDYADLQSFTQPTITPIATPTPHLFISEMYANDIGGNTNGVEIAPSWQVRPWWRLAGSYSYVGIDMHANAPSSDVSSTGSVATYEGSTPHHEGEIQSTFNLPAGFEFDQFFRASSGLPAQNVNAYTTADVRLGYRHHDWELSAVGQNLLQPHHLEWGTGDPGQTPLGIRRAFYLQLTFAK